jgi:hypothetical protein
LYLVCRSASVLSHALKRTGEHQEANPACIGW